MLLLHSTPKKLVTRIPSPFKGWKNKKISELNLAGQQAWGGKQKGKGVELIEGNGSKNLPPVCFSDSAVLGLIIS